MRLLDLAVLILKEHGPRAVQHPGPPFGKRRRVLRGVDAVARGLHTHEGDGIVEQRVEHADRVRAAAHARDHEVGSRPSASRHWARVSRPITD